jgi:hypothetical protein
MSERTEWEQQIDHILSELVQLLKNQEARLERLETGYAELGQEVLALIERLDRQETEQRALASRLSDLEHRAQGAAVTA